MAKIWVIIVFIGSSIPMFGIDKEEKTVKKAIRAGDIEFLKSYLEKYPDANCLFSNGKTGLYYAIIYDQVMISEFLLRRGADPDLLVGDHSTLYWAINYNRVNIVRLLIEFGAEVNRPDHKQSTPLIYAAELNNPGMCKILINRGADPLHTNLYGKKASDYAFIYGESPAYKYLLSMEKQCENQDTVPSMKDGPYIFLEGDDRIVMTYYERNQEKNLTRLIEKTFYTGKADTVLKGFGWDMNSYHITDMFTPDSSYVKTAGNIFVIGDVHGKLHALVKLLKNNKIIDSDLKWIFGEGQLIQLGDVFDRGAFVTETLWFLYDLQIQARNSGGDVHLLLGNHEIMAMTGDHRYLNPKYEYFTHYTQTEYYQLFDTNSVLGRWLRCQNIILRINDYLFLHAGISPEFAAYGYAYPDVNSRIRKYLNSDGTFKDGSPEDIILGAIGPLWYRGYMDPYKGQTEITQEFVDNYLSSRGLKRMVLGHNEQRTIKISFEGRIISADVALDDSGKTAQGLLISGDDIFRCYSDGTKERLE